MQKSVLFVLGLFLGFASAAEAHNIPLDMPAPAVCPDPKPTLSGVDLSGFEPNTNWPVVAQPGILDFVFVKATEGVDYINREFTRDWQGSRAVNMVHGAYHFFQPGDDPIRQAQFYLRTVGEILPSDLPPMLDLEVTRGISAGTVVKRLKLWLNYVEEKTGRTPIIYTYPGFWHKLGDPKGFENYPLFIAHMDVPCPDVPSPWQTWTFWQHTKSTTPGILGKVDQDLFQGSLSDFQSIVSSGFISDDTRN